MKRKYKYLNRLRSQLCYYFYFKKGIEVTEEELDYYIDVILDMLFYETEIEIKSNDENYLKLVIPTLSEDLNITIDKKEKGDFYE